MLKRHPLSPMLFLMRNPGRSLPLTLVLALAVLTIASVVALLNSIDRTILKIYDYNRYFAAITPRGSNKLKQELVERIERAPYYAASYETVVCFMNAETIVGKMPFVIFGLEQDQMEPLAARCRLDLREGRYPLPGEAGVVLSEPLMRNKNLKLGDVVLSPLIPDQYAPVPVRVVGVLHGDTWLAIGSLEFIRDNFFPPTRNLLIFATEPRYQPRLDAWIRESTQGRTGARVDLRRTARGDASRLSEPVFHHGDCGHGGGGDAGDDDGAAGEYLLSAAVGGVRATAGDWLHAARAADARVAGDDYGRRAGLGAGRAVRDGRPALGEGAHYGAARAVYRAVRPYRLPVYAACAADGAGVRAVHDWLATAHL
jgi:hypothetical protein